MTLAKETYSKNPSEIPSFAINCGPVMQSGETVSEVITAEITQTYKDGSAIVAEDQVTVQGAAPNDDEICEPGKERIGPGRGIVGFISGGASAAVPYRLTIPFLTSGGQRRDAEILLRIL